MQRGYFKFWRKAEDSVSWTRGLAYRGMMVTILDGAAWKPRFEWGLEVQPGEFLVKVGAWADTFGMSRSSVVRMLQTLTTDGFISVTNVNNRYTRITVLNWHIYQQENMSLRTTDGQPADNQRSTGDTTSGQPYLYDTRVFKTEEGKKERREEINTPLTPQAGEEGDEDFDMKLTPRQTGTNPRASGTNPRAEGKNPRAQNTNPRAKPFVPPSEDEVDAYCLERRNGISGRDFCDFYAARGWMLGKNRMKDWRAAVRTWENKREAERLELERTRASPVRHVIN